MNIVVVNFSVSARNKKLNMDAMDSYVKTAADRGADMILFPEMSLTGYDGLLGDAMTREAKLEIAEAVDGPSVRHFAGLASQLGICIIWGMPIREQEQGSPVLYNAAVAASPACFGPCESPGFMLEGSSVYIYRKIHPFGAENTWCKKGTEPVLLPSVFGPIGLGICYDTYQFPELMRYYVWKGARLYVNVTAQPEEVDKPMSRRAFLDYYGPLLDYGVLCNTIFVASANLTGLDEITTFGGGSCVLGPRVTPFFETNVACYGGSKENNEPGISFASVDLSLATRRLCTASPYTGEPDYRPELYRTFK